MKIIDKLKKQSVGVRKAVTIGALFVIAVPFLILIGLNLKSKVENYEQPEGILKGLNFPNGETASPAIKGETGPLWDEFEAASSDDYNLPAAGSESEQESEGESEGESDGE